MKGVELRVRVSVDDSVERARKFLEDAFWQQLRAALPKREFDRRVRATDDDKETRR